MNLINPENIKRYFDIVVSILLIIVGFWLFLIIILCIFISMGRPIFFKQRRIGKNGHVFTLIKFRTMVVAREDIQSSDSSRLTTFGSFLRTTSLDEIPELINVLRGDMSLVGPRPLLVEYRELYDEFQWRRHEVKPGITGLAQVRGRNAIDWIHRFKLDVWYVDHWSLSLDFKILYETFAVVYSRRGISAQGEATMRKFSKSHNERV